MQYECPLEPAVGVRICGTPENLILAHWQYLSVGSSRFVGVVTSAAQPISWRKTSRQRSKLLPSAVEYL